MSNAWVFQDDKQVKQHGADAASWYVGWYAGEGPARRKRCKSCGPGAAGQGKAEKLRRKIEGELAAGTYREQIKTTWATFRQEYEEKVLAGLAVRTRESATSSFDAFERHVSPSRVFYINTAVVDDFVSKRRKDPGDKKGSTISPATVNKDLRHLKAALTVAEEWGYLPKVPKFRMEKAPKKLPLYVTGDHFAAIYGACDKARFPELAGVTAGDWWRALIVTAYMTGWRIGDLLGLKRSDLDLKSATAITRGEDNKGKRDELVKLSPVVVEHLEKLAGFTTHVFTWDYGEVTLYRVFATIQEEAGIHLACDGQHEHTRYCHVYGFHDLRRAFATMNADRLSADALQKLMRHKSYATTQVYINLGRQMDEAVAKLYVPDVLKKKAP